MQGNLLGVAGTRYHQQVVFRHIEPLVQVVRHDLVLLGNHALHSRDNNLRAHRTFDLLERRLEVRRRDSQHKDIRVAHHDVDIVRKMDAADVERRTVQVRGVLACALELLNHLSAADEPVDFIHVRENNLCKGSCPTATAYNSNSLVFKHFYYVLNVSI